MAPRNSHKKTWITDAALCRRIELWFEGEKEKIRHIHGTGTEESTCAILNLEKRSMMINDLRWSEMKYRGRYRLPLAIQTHIVRYMRQHDIIQKSRKKSGDRIQKLYEELGVGLQAWTAEGLLPDFICLCRNKIDNFIQAKGRMMKQQKFFTLVENKIKWESWTEQWLDPEWDGELVDNIATKRWDGNVIDNVATKMGISKQQDNHMPSAVVIKEHVDFPPSPESGNVEQQLYDSSHNDGPWSFPDMFTSTLWNVSEEQPA